MSWKFNPFTGKLDFVVDDHGDLLGLDTGADHSYIDQDVTNGSSPIFDGANFTGIPISGTALVAGTNITLAGDTLNVDDAFLINDGDDVTSGSLTADKFVTTHTTSEAAYEANQHDVTVTISSAAEANTYTINDIDTSFTGTSGSGFDSISPVVIVNDVDHTIDVQSGISVGTYRYLDLNISVVGGGVLARPIVQIAKVVIDANSSSLISSTTSANAPMSYTFQNPNTGQAFTEGFFSLDVTGNSGEVVAAYTRAKASASSAAHAVGYKGYALSPTGTTGTNVGVEGYSYSQAGSNVSSMIALKGTIINSGSIVLNKVFAFKGTGGHIQTAGGSLWLTDTVLASLSPTHVSITGTNEAYVEGDVEVDGVTYCDGGSETGDSTNKTLVSSTGDITQVGTARIDWTKKAANGVTLTNFTSASAVGDLQTANDGTTYTATEVAGGNNNLVVDFTGVTAFNWVKLLAYYNGNAVHNIQVQIEITPFDGSAWHTFDSIENQGATTNTYQNHDFFIPSDTAYINSGVVKIRLLHSASTSAGHTLVIDECSLYQ